MAKRGRKPGPALEPEQKAKRYSVATANKDVQRWVEAQSNRSASFEMLIRLFMKLYDVEAQDIFETLMDNPLLLGGLRETSRRESDIESTTLYHTPAPLAQPENPDVDEDEDIEVDEEDLEDKDLNEDEDESESSEDEDEETEVDEPEEVEEETKVEETKKGTKSTKNSSSASKTGTRKKRTSAKKRNLKGDDFFG